MAQQSETSQQSDSRNGAPTALAKVDPSAPPRNKADLSAFLNSAAVQRQLNDATKGALEPLDFVRLTLTAESKNPDILRCTRSSIVRALLDAAQLGILPGGTLGRGYLVPRFNKKVDAMELNFDPGWRGLIDIALRTRKVKRIQSYLVYEGERFVPHMGTREEIEHEMRFDIPRSDDKIVAAYAVAEFARRVKTFEICSMQDINKIRAVSKAKYGPWFDWFDQMARKTSIRRLCRGLPFDPVLDRALELAAAVDIDPDREDGPRFISTPSQVAAALPQADPARAKTDRVAERVKARAQQPPEPSDHEPPSHDGDDDGGQR